MSASTERLAKAIRADALKMVHRARASHVGSALSVADILSVLYGEVLRHRPQDPSWAERDVAIVSKGHAASVAYAVLARSGYFSPDLLNGYLMDDSPLAGHLTRSDQAPGVEWSTGSLGHGLPVAVGIALHRWRSSHPGRVFVIMSDGECDEGTTWESALLAAHHGLANLLVIIDANGIQSFGRTDEVLGLEPLMSKWEAFGWQTTEVDGHDHDALSAAMGPTTLRRPTAVIARTVKGAGVSFMQNDLAWHYRSPDDAQLAAALAELSGD